MSSGEREIPQRELRNNVAGVLREVASGARLRITVRGRPVADLIPVGSGRRFVSASDVGRILHETPLDAAFEADVDRILGGTIEEL
jgi:prevent-host-death family protein